MKNRMKKTILLMLTMFMIVGVNYKNYGLSLNSRKAQLLNNSRFTGTYSYSSKENKFENLTKAVKWNEIIRDYSRANPNPNIYSEAQKIYYVASYINRHARNRFFHMLKNNGFDEKTALRGTFLKAARTIYLNIKTTYSAGTYLKRDFKGTWNAQTWRDLGPNVSFDCSGYVASVLFTIGYFHIKNKDNKYGHLKDPPKLPKSQQSMFQKLFEIPSPNSLGHGEENLAHNQNLMVRITRDEVEPGDLVEWKKGRGQYGHIGIVNGVEKKNGKTVKITSMIHAYNGVTARPSRYKTYINGLQNTFLPFNKETMCPPDINGGQISQKICTESGIFKEALTEHNFKYLRIVERKDIENPRPFKFNIDSFLHKCENPNKDYSMHVYCNIY